MEQTVIFSERAFTALLTETLAEIKTETGGIFLGQHHNGKWYIIESIDPGPNSIFSSAYFEYNEAYVNHLANKINILYKNPLKIMGLWHRHPGSMDFFSSTDNSTHEKYANINTFGVISALVNIDPSFRLSIYSITGTKGRLNIPRTKLNYSVGNEKIPNEYLMYNPADLIKRKIDGFMTQNAGRGDKLKLMEKIITKIFNANAAVDEEPVRVKDSELEEIIKTLEEDIAFFSEHGIQCAMALAEDHTISFYGEIERGKKSHEMRLFMNKEKMFVKYKNKTIIYGSGLFSESMN
ncbi:MAG: Mov34/MPN/PAD-1 family protein [Treponema sp.]|nr:Mov34/MPN/PAD-1 family protein [Treponema sp.]